MARDFSYNQLCRDTLSGEHLYGEKIQIISTPFLTSMLAKLCSNKTTQPDFNRLITLLYQALLERMVSVHFPLTLQKIPTRMVKYHEVATIEGMILDSKTKVVTVDIARAGTLPSQTAFDFFNNLLNPDYVRQDHFYVNRKVNDQGKVIGVDYSGSKIGGDVDDAIVIFPDPMGATGGTISHAVTHYKNSVPGKVKKFISLHLIVTPEFLMRMKQDHPDVEIMAIRVDRGLSSEDILKTIPGTHWKQEKGLNENQYIVPGGGGFGELMNNTEK